MPLELHNVGEELVADLLNRLDAKGRLADVACRECRKPLDQLVAVAGKYERSRPNIAFDVSIGGNAVRTDPMHKIDVAVYGADSVFPVEVKLGKGQLGIARVCTSITGMCKLRKGGKYLNGPMWSLLARSGDAAGAAIEVRQFRRPVTEDWALVLRRSVYAKWAKNKAKKTLHAACPHAHVLVFEDLVTAIVRLATPFRDVIEDVVGFDADAFAEKWRTAE